MPRKRESLVCEYLERVNIRAFEEYPAILKAIVTGHGVYALYKKRKLYYVGLAKNLRSRIKTHMRDRHGGKWDNFSVYSTINNRHMKELESLLIRIIKATGNSQGGKFARAENLQRKFRSRLRHEHKVKEALLLGRKPPTLKESGSVRRAREQGNKWAGLVDRTRTIRRDYKGTLYKARLRPNGSVRMKGKTYGSPTDATEAAIRRRYNGSYFWTIERAPGQWVILRKIMGR